MTGQVLTGIKTTSNNNNNNTNTKSWLIFLFDSLNGITVPKCGQTVHLKCLQEMLKHAQYCCPICSKSVIDMTNVWKRIHEEIEATPQVEKHQNMKVWIICNDCDITSDAFFHIFGLKRSHCNSYNTRKNAPHVLPS